MIEMPNWTTAATCAGTDPADFHAGGTRIERRHAEARAKMVCAECPVRLKCLRWQLDYEGDLSAGSRYGVYGGLNPTERARLARGAA